MNETAPRIYRHTADQVVRRLEERLAALGWNANPPTGTPRPGAALVRLFGRLADVVISRFDQVPEKHFRAFLGEAGVDLLPPRPARAEVTFTPAKDAPAALLVPAGTQVAAKRSESRPEIIFETERDLTVSRAELTACFALDPVCLSDRSEAARAGDAGSFPAFLGDTERERVLYLDDPELFIFSDDTSRAHAEISLTFTFAEPGQPDLDGWALAWEYFDGSAWRSLEAAGARLDDGTDGFRHDGTVRLTGLPLLVRQEFDPEQGAWLVCRLTGGSERRHLPTVTAISASRRIDIPGVAPRPAEALFTAINGGSAVVPLEPEGEYYPFGQNPGRLDAFYLKANEALTKEGAVLELTFGLEGVGEKESSSSLTSLRLEWAYSSTAGWTRLGTSSRSGVSDAILDFSETSAALTATAARHTVTFTVPPARDAQDIPGSAAATVGDQKGRWLRLRVIQGGYQLDLPEGNRCYAPERRPPLVKGLRLSYRDYRGPEAPAKPLPACASRVDGALRRHLLDGAAISPFASDCDEPALYLGFGAPFPAGSWLQLLVDPDELRHADETLPAVIWEYRSSFGPWQPLPANDGSAGLRTRGYLGFYGPADQGQHEAFGRTCWWLRARPHRDPPVAAAPADLTVDPGSGDVATVLLDAAGSRAFDGCRVARYHWRLVPFPAAAGEERYAATGTGEATVTLDASTSEAGSGRTFRRYTWRLVDSSQLSARAGSDRLVNASDDVATVLLDASASADLEGGSLRSYRWRLVSPAEPGQEPAAAPVSPFLRGVRANTVPAVNAQTLREEILGSSSGSAGQSFRLHRAPVLPDLVLYVRENDRPPAVELDQVEAELGAAGEGETLEAYPTFQEAERGDWVRWRRVDDFFSSGPESRHFVLDQVNGEVRFGDGSRGRIPPLGRDAVRAARYRTHQGGSGNVAAREVALVRNPSGPLTAVKGVANPEAAAGGSAAETVADVRQRGPKSLKHRGKAITHEDFAWLARESGGEVARAWCLPTRDANGVTREGWVTVVVLPQAADVRPSPQPALLRMVRSYLEERTLVNLVHDGHLLVVGPAYVTAEITARVVPRLPEQADAVKLAVTERLRDFLDPLAGGPERHGWELGRDVYRPEIFAEIEAVSGVDYCAGVSLAASLQQLQLSLGQDVALPVPAGSRVATFDERLRLVLAEPLTGREPTRLLAVHGCKAGDRVSLVDGENRVLRRGLIIAGLAADGAELRFDQLLADGGDLPELGELALLSADQRVRLPLADWLREDEAIVGATVQWFRPGDLLCLVAGPVRTAALEFLPVAAVAPRHDRITVPEGHLVTPGTITVEMVLAE